MQPIPLGPCPTTINWGTFWAAVGAIGTSLAAVISCIALGLACRQLRAAREQLADAHEQNLASRVDNLLAVVSTGEVGAARDNIYALAISQPKKAPLKPLDPDARRQVFILLWALQRVSVLAPVITASGKASVYALTDQVTRIVDTFLNLGPRLDNKDKRSMTHSRTTTCSALESLEKALASTPGFTEQNWSKKLDNALTPRMHRCCRPRRRRLRAGAGW